jgi:hypothetical protein
MQKSRAGHMEVRVRPGRGVQQVMGVGGAPNKCSGSSRVLQVVLPKRCKLFG